MCNAGCTCSTHTLDSHIHYALQLFFFEEEELYLMQQDDDDGDGDEDLQEIKEGTPPVWLCAPTQTDTCGSLFTASLW